MGFFPVKNEKTAERQHSHVVRNSFGGSLPCSTAENSRNLLVPEYARSIRLSEKRLFVNLAWSLDAEPWIEVEMI
jgi:hypothetical protein